MKKEKPAKLANRSSAPRPPAPAKQVVLRLPRNYTWTGNGYHIAHR